MTKMIKKNKALFDLRLNSADASRKETTRQMFNF